MNAPEPDTGVGATRTAFESYLKFLAEAPRDGTPVVLETGHALSLHFDVLATQSFMSLRDPDRLVLGYTRTMMGFLLLQPAPARISAIGLGGGSLVKYCYRHLQNTKVVAVEIDPAVIALRERFRIPPDDARLEVVCADGAEYVKGQEAQPDVILVDGFLADGMPLQLGTADFYAACHARLADNGVLVANFLASDGDIPFYLAALQEVFGAAMSVARAEDSCNYTLFAWKSRQPLPSLPALLARARALEPTHRLKLTATARRMKRGEHVAADASSWHTLARPRGLI